MFEGSNSSLLARESLKFGQPSSNLGVSSSLSSGYGFSGRESLYRERVIDELETSEE